MWLSWPHRNHGAILPMWRQAIGLKSHHDYAQAPCFFGGFADQSTSKCKRMSWQVKSVDIKIYQVGWNVLQYTRDSCQNCSKVGRISGVATVWRSHSIPTVSSLLPRQIASKALLVFCAQQVSQWSFFCQLWDNNHRVPKAARAISISRVSRVDNLAYRYHYSTPFSRLQATFAADTTLSPTWRGWLNRGIKFRGKTRIAVKWVNVDSPKWSSYWEVNHFWSTFNVQDLK